MSIMVNDGGVLYELDAVTANEGGVLYNLDTVQANEGGVLQEIFSASPFPKELVWTVPSGGVYGGSYGGNFAPVLGTPYVGKPSASQPSWKPDKTQCARASFVLKAPMTVTVKVTGVYVEGAGIDTYLWQVYPFYYDSVSGSLTGLSNSHIYVENKQVTYTFPSYMVGRTITLCIYGVAVVPGTQGSYGGTPAIQYSFSFSK